MKIRLDKRTANILSLRSKCLTITVLEESIKMRAVVVLAHVENIS